MATRFQQHGPIRVSAAGTHLAHADGTPFFFLADTAWNGPLLASDADWETYLDDRAARGFSAIQFITHAPWSAALADAQGQVALADPHRGALHREFFDRIDHRMAAINARGMLAVPVLAWAADFGPSRRLNIGHWAGAALLEGFIRAQVERLAHHHVMWVLAGDGVYTWLRALKWKRIGRDVFGAADAPQSRAPVALHPAGGTWPYASFADEPWLDVWGYQSSHGDHPRLLRWLQQGPPAWFWRKRLARGRRVCPTLNLEPVYEGIAPVPGRGPFGADTVRAALWWSLLSAPTAGVAYGAHGVWSWQNEPGEPLNHRGLGIARPWREALAFPGSAQAAHLAALMRRIDWWRLRPAPELLRQGGEPGPRHIALSASPGRDLVVAYLPAGAGALKLHPAALAAISRWTWFNPRTGREETIDQSPGPALSPPDDQDWVGLSGAPAQRSDSP